MKIKHVDPVPEEGKPFANCAFGREQYATILSSIVQNYFEGFVLALNSEWGTGKTIFVKMWRQQLNDNEFQTLYFNAWENDFEPNPLVAFLAELKEVPTSSNTTFKDLLQKGTTILKSVAPVLVKAVVDKFISTALITEAIEKATEGAAEVMQDEMNEYTKKKDGIKEFKESLKRFVESVKKRKPIIFIIDELDRCRPNYAVELLEQVKHFFSVPGIVFVLSIDKEQLGHAVRGVYGSHLLNADEYLRRFIDLEFSIPAPPTEKSVTHFYKYFQFDDFIGIIDRQQVSRDDREAIITVASLLFDKARLNLRQQEKIFAHARLALQSFHPSRQIYPSMFILMAFLKHHHGTFYQDIKTGTLDLDTLLQQFFELCPKTIDRNKTWFLPHLEALLVVMYNNSFPQRPDHGLILKDDKSGEESPIVRTKFTQPNSEANFLRIIRELLGRIGYGEIGVGYIANKIDLLENIVF